MHIVYNKEQIHQLFDKSKENGHTYIQYSIQCTVQADSNVTFLKQCRL